MFMTGSTVTVTDATFAEAVLASERPVVVDFWAEWCPPCHMISRVLDELAVEFGDAMTVAKLNYDENPETGRAYGVLSLPTLLVFRGGEVVDTMIGARSKAVLRNALSAHMTP
jgi:thioredoxin